MNSVLGRLHVQHRAVAEWEVRGVVHKLVHEGPLEGGAAVKIGFARHPRIYRGNDLGQALFQLVHAAADGGKKLEKGNRRLVQLSLLCRVSGIAKEVAAIDFDHSPWGETESVALLTFSGNGGLPEAEARNLEDFLMARFPSEAQTIS